MNADRREGKKNKTRLIGFRVDEDAFSELENRAILAGKTTNDWCRDELLVRLRDGTMLTANEQLIHEEIVVFGSAMVHFFESLIAKQLTPEISNDIKEFIISERKDTYQNYFAKRKEGK